jgi:hypothetical protein
MGPALVLKSVLGRHVSLGVFGVVQIVIDVESVSNILLGRFPVHDHLHTLPGALAVAAVVTLLARAPLSWVNGWLRRREDVPRWLRDELLPVTWLSAGLGAGLGGATHVLFDGMMHADARPFAPFVSTNVLLVPGSFEAIHGACAVAGVLGLVLWSLFARRAPGA